MRCPTKSGPFQCEKEAGHETTSECECAASEYATARLPCVIAAVKVDREAATLPPAAETTK